MKWWPFARPSAEPEVGALPVQVSGWRDDWRARPQGVRELGYDQALLWVVATAGNGRTIYAKRLSD